MEVSVIEPVMVPTLFGSTDPNAIIADATAKANALAKVVKDKRLASNIQGKEYVRVEGWTLLGSLLGVFPVCTWTRPVETGWEARVEARTLDGHVVGAAEAQCCRDENTWKSRSEYALRSMAQTRATSKAMRLPLGFVMALAGFEATPFEEIPDEESRAPAQAPQTPVEPPKQTDLTPNTRAAVESAIKEVRAARAEEFTPMVYSQLKAQWPDVFTAKAMRLALLTEAQALDVLELLDQETPPDTEAEQPALVDPAGDDAAMVRAR